MISIFVYIIILMIIPFIKDKRKINILFIINCIILGIYIYSMRKTSLDYSAYIEYYKTSISGGPIYFEKGFLFLNKLIGILDFNNLDNIFIIYYAIMITLMYFSMRYFLKNGITISLFLSFTLSYLSNGMIVLIRQYIAIFLFVYASRYIIERRLFKYLIIIIIASLIHKSILIFIPLYWIININKYKNYQKIGLIVGSFLIGIIIFIKFLPKYMNYFYLESLEGNKIGLFSIYVFIMFAVYCYYTKFNKNDLNNMITILGVIGIVSMISLSKVGFVQRIAFYFKPFIVIGISLIPCYISKLKNLGYFIILSSNLIIFGM